MNTWVLILFMGIGAVSDKDSMALTTAYFASEQACKYAGESTKQFESFTKSRKYVCVPTGVK